MKIGFWVFLGTAAAVAGVLGAVVWYVRKRIRRFSMDVFGRPDLLGALKDVDTVADQDPRSLNACDSLLLPQILRDFPDFDPVEVKARLEKYLRKELGRHEGFTLYNTAMAKYLPSALQKTIVYQAAVSWLESGVRKQKRFNVHYAYRLHGADESVAANCPNCGGALGFGQRECPYCGSRVANVLGNVWEFVELKES